jgi:hypothetical protein
MVLKNRKVALFMACQHRTVATKYPEIGRSQGGWVESTHLYGLINLEC